MLLPSYRTNMTKLQIIEVVGAIFIYGLLKLLLNRYIDAWVTRNIASNNRSRIVKKTINITIFVVFLTILLSIFGVDQSELAVFIGSFLTVMGIALFAQWSILSNITSGVIIFFNHSVKLDDTIIIMEKDYEIEGRISDIGLFFVSIITKDNERIEIPNIVFLNKMIKKKGPAM